MTPDAILLALREAGITVTVNGNRLHLEGPVALLKSELLSEARQQRDALLAAVAGGVVVDRLGTETYCNSATVPPITSQVPEGLTGFDTVAVPLARLLQSDKTATVDRCAVGLFAQASAATSSEGATVAVLENCNSTTTRTATAITGQVPERNADENADCCTVAVDFAGCGAASVDDGFTDDASPELDTATAEYERLWHVWIALADAGRRDEAAAIISGPYLEAGERMNALLSKGHAA
jgi:hypothetical protein